MAKQPSKSTPKPKSTTSSQIVDVVALERREVVVALIGETPMIFNRMAEKVKQGLLLPAGRLTAADKLARLKHDPLAEFRSSPYRLTSDKEATLLGIPAGAFKKAIAQAAVDIPGAARTQIGRLTRVLVSNENNLVPIYGLPYIKMDVTKQADINRTPDVRTRAAIKQWAAILRISFVHPNLNQKTIVNLLNAAGLIVGVGDWRQEKGSGDFGSWHVTDADDPKLREIMRVGARAAQIEAMATPMYFDTETQDLIEWYEAELERRRGKEQSESKSAA